MKICLQCHAEFKASDWQCAHCGGQPQEAAGYPAFAPHLNDAEEGFRLDSHEGLDKVQETNFWFRGRNKLILALARQNFPELLADGPGRSALEIGCGTGFVLSALATAFPDVTFIGSEAHSLALPFAARRVPKNVDLIQLDGREIPYRDEIDFLGAFDVLEHIEEDTSVLSEMYKATRPGGGIMVTVPQHPALWSYADDVAHHKRRYIRGEMQKKIAGAGFRIVRATSFVSILLPAMFLSRQLNKDGQATKVEFALPPLINRCFESTLDIERWAIGMGVSLPIGGSMLVVAKKPA